MTALASEELSYLCSFEFPTPGDWTAGVDSNIQSNRALSCLPHTAISVPFLAHREARMHVVTAALTNGVDIQSFAFILPSSTILKHLAYTICRTDRETASTLERMGTGWCMYYHRSVIMEIVICLVYAIPLRMTRMTMVTPNTY